jgi:hypothetical protein
LFVLALVVQPCLGQKNYAKIGRGNIVIKFKLFGPETSNVLTVNVDRFTHMAEPPVLVSLK